VIPINREGVLTYICETFFTLYVRTDVLVYRVHTYVCTYLRGRLMATHLMTMPRNEGGYNYESCSTSFRNVQLLIGSNEIEAGNYRNSVPLSSSLLSVSGKFRSVDYY
jgi:hypothetical protein